VTDEPEHGITGPKTAPARLVDLADLLGGESGPSRKFLGGLVIGALVGAALAGTSVMRRRSRAGTQGDARTAAEQATADPQA